MQRDPGPRIVIGNVELSFERQARSEPARPLIGALSFGAWHGAWTVAVGAFPIAVVYLLRWSWLDLPWSALGAQMATFIPVCGACYGGGIAMGEACASRAYAEKARPPRMVRALLTIALAALGGAIGGLGPGAFAAEHFGRIPAPYFGTLEILSAGALSFFLLGAALLWRSGIPLARAFPALALSLLAPSFLGLLVWASMPATAWIADTAVLATADSAPSLGLFGAGFGAFVGVLFGGLLGLARAISARRTI
jgi:hypothetical protein